jgi:preprotein translocase subunit SecD
MKSSPLKIVLSLVTVAIFVALGGAIWLIGKYYPFGTTIERNGGTILVYEVDEGSLPEDYKSTEMAEAIRRRIDPLKLDNVTVRPDGAKRIEIRIARGDDHAQRVEQIKEMLGLAGDLEFRILANEQDEKEVIEATKRYFADAKNDPKVGEELDRRNAAGQLPPSPPGPHKDGFDANKGIFKYSWLELGYGFRAEHGFDDAAETEEDAVGSPTLRAQQWHEAAEARKKNECFQQAGLGGPLFCSREVAPIRREAHGRKKYEYFVLTRDLEEGMENPGKYLDKAFVGVDQSIAFHLSEEGAELMGDLTSRNIGRQMAVILDGQVMSSANIQSKIGSDGQITGRFTKGQVARLVAILHAGALPARLKPMPVREEEVKPPKGR